MSQNMPQSGALVVVGNRHADIDPQNDQYVQAWRVLITARDDGLIRLIGV